jgi:hypothetical protein
LAVDCVFGVTSENQLAMSTIDPNIFSEYEYAASSDSADTTRRLRCSKLRSARFYQRQRSETDRDRIYDARESSPRYCEF